MMTPTKQKYLELAPQHTESELANILGVTDSSIRRYARELKVKPKTNRYSNHPLEWYPEEFKHRYGGRLELAGTPYRKKNGHVAARCRCLRCGYEWTTDLNAKFRMSTGCGRCDKGHYGNKYSIAETEGMLNTNHAGQWQIIEYGHYSKKDSVVRCTLCGAEHTVKLADMIASTTKRCTACQTGSFGEFVIANTLKRNCIPFKREYAVQVNGRKRRIDFLVDGGTALEYSGPQHFEQGLYYSDDINKGVKEKKQWCRDNGIKFVEIVATHTVSSIVHDLSDALGIHLETPDAEWFAEHDADMPRTLTYMKTHSSRQTSKDLQVPIAKIRKYVMLAGYKSISDWQSENRVD